MKFITQLLFLSLLAVASVFTACGDDDMPQPSTDLINITGKVSDDAGTALADVTVTSVADNTKNTKTAADGTFSLTGIPKNDMVKFEKSGYVTVEMAAAPTLDVVMNRGAGAQFAEYFTTAGNMVKDPAFAANSIKPTADLGSLSAYPAGFTTVNYKGAVDPNAAAWYAGWSFYENLINGQTTSDPFATGPTEIWDEAKMTAAGNTVNWTADKTYVLDGFVFVNSGQTLNIEAGTVVQGKPGEDVDASALVVARGGKINANGTASKPIIFTFEGDNGGTDATVRGQWGGLIILGAAGLNSTPGTTQIEGIPTNEPRGNYGGTNNDDNSGTLRYVSIRHGGTNIGADNEINGLTLGGVGSGTTIEYIEVVGNKDDGIEWFGGTVAARYVISAFCADDALDYDEGYRGRNQFVIVHQDPSADAADRGGEHDGGTTPETGTPYATPVFYNVTSIGNTGSRTLTFRDNAGGEYHNSIFVGFGKGIDIEDLEGQEQDSFRQWKDGNLKLEHNVFFNIKEGDSAAAIFKVSN